MRTFKKVVVDTDVLLYKVGFATQKNVYILESSGEVNGEIYVGSDKRLVNRLMASLDNPTLSEELRTEPLLAALKTVDNVLAKYKELFQPEEMLLYLTGSGNYREALAGIKPYKGNRTQEKPAHYAAIKEYLIKLGAVVIEGAEADDALSMAMWADPENTVGITIDKDAKNTPGWLYNPDKGQLISVTDMEARHHFWAQVLTGDQVDNIQGVPGVGPKKAEGMLGECVSEKDYYGVCLAAYTAHQKKMFPTMSLASLTRMAEKDLEENARLLWMSRETYNDWRCV